MRKSKPSSNLVSLLKHMNITDAKISKGRIFVELENVPLPKSKYRVVKSETEVGSWAKERYRNIIRIDNDITRRHWMLSLLCHEVVERWVYETFFKHLTVKKVYKTIHDVAENIEKKFHIENFGMQSWNQYSKKIEEVWKKENA